MSALEPLTPVFTAQLFPDLQTELIALLRSLQPEDWQRPTMAGTWRVRDVVAHLLDGDLRKLSGGRDAHRLTARPLHAFDDVVAFINELNGAGVRCGDRLSPRVMTDLLVVSGAWVADYVAGLPAHEESRIPVAWAGESRSDNWMDVGREYTERWHHQMQLRAAVGAAPLLERRWFQPVMDLSVRAFRRSFAGVSRADGASAVFGVRDEPGLEWTVVRSPAGWEVLRGQPAAPHASVIVSADDAWRLLYNALPEPVARARAAADGDPDLVKAIFGTRSVMV